MSEEKNRFEYQRPTDESVESIKKLRQACKDMNDLILAELPNTRERSLAITKLEESSMWMNKCVVFNQEEKKEDE